MLYTGIIQNYTQVQINPFLQKTPHSDQIFYQVSTACPWITANSCWYGLNIQFNNNR